MMTNKSITSGQKNQIARLTEVAAGNATHVALEQVPMDSDVAQVKVISDGDLFQKMIQPQIAKIVAEALNRLSGRKHQQAEPPEQYFAEVLGYTLDLSGVVFPEKVGFTTYMVVPADINEDYIFRRITEHFKVGQYAWQSPVADNVNRKIEQKRPQGLYVFAHAGGDEPDAKHLGKSYDDAMAVNMTFMNPKEYLLATGFHHFINKDHFMDVKGCTRTSSLWWGGGLVSGGFHPGVAGLASTMAIVTLAVRFAVHVSCFWVEFILDPFDFYPCIWVWVKSFAIYCGAFFFFIY